MKSLSGIATLTLLLVVVAMPGNAADDGKMDIESADACIKTGHFSEAEKLYAQGACRAFGIVCEPDTLGIALWYAAAPPRQTRGILLRMPKG